MVGFERSFCQAQNQHAGDDETFVGENADGLCWHRQDFWSTILPFPAPEKPRAGGTPALLNASDISGVHHDENQES
jgi:hypothetical protein